MKKILTFMAIAMIVSSANAVSFKWTSDSIKFGSTSVGANATGYLVFIGSNTLGSQGYTFDDIIGMDSVASASTKLSKMNVPNMADTGTGVGNYVMFLTYQSGDDTYYNVSADTYTISASAYEKLMTEGTALPATAFSNIGSTVNEKGAQGSIGGGWYTPVPEPGTAAMALLGLGMLIRRRRKA